MKQVIQSYKTGELRVADVAPPAPRPGSLLIRTHYSLISAGTERAMIELAQKSLLGKARARPDLVRKVLNKGRRDGWLNAYQAAMRRLDNWVPLGYSAAGTVLKAGEGITGFSVGDSVACAGIGFASHAEQVVVPQNLCVPIPRGVSFAEAAYVALGSIALQGLRIGDVQLGERAAVIGLGLVGQLTFRLLKAAGCKVMGIDVQADKVHHALAHGIDAACLRGAAQLGDLVEEFTGGMGFDVVFITAASSSSDPMDLAGDIARDRGRVTVVGGVSTQFSRNVYYQKELQVRLSRSYGPGRYDPSYEEQGLDYPVAYVRWTENRNMAAFLEQLASKAIDIRDLSTHEFPIEAADKAYGLIEQKSGPSYFGVLLKYHPELPLPDSVSIAPTTRTIPSGQPASKGPAVGVGIIGVGRFATGTLLPELSRVKGVRFVNITSASGVSAVTVGQKYGFARSSSNPEALISDPEVRAVMILTRNSSHAPLTIQALRQKKAVFVEKPLSTSLEQLRECVQAWKEVSGQVMVGFNRRHAEFTARLKEFLAGRTGPVMAVYRVNPGPLAREDWVRIPEEGGSRIIAEACHFVDYLQAVLGAVPTRVYARGLRTARGDGAPSEDIVAHLDFADGSLGTIVYTAEGDPSFSKERVEFYTGGRVAMIDDFRELTMVRGGRHQHVRRRFSQDKGHRREMEVFIRAVQSGEGLREEFPAYALATLTTFRIMDSLRSDAPVPVNPEDIALEF
jgi:predicted dehydrogenase/threonine dehydrogenase-like Zn-dependent dehydrogenase